MSLSFGQLLLLAILIGIFLLSLLTFLILQKAKRKPITTSTTKLNTEEPTQILPIQIVRISLQDKNLLINEQFNETIKEFLQNKNFYLEKYSPFFIVKDGKPKRFYPIHSVDSLFEKITLLWKAGFILKEAALALLFYYEATNKEDLIPFLFKLLTVKNIPLSEKNIIFFLYQEELNFQVVINDIDFSISKRLFFSYKHFWEKKPISRQVYRKLLIEDILPNDEEFQKEIYSLATKALCLYLLKEGELHQKTQEIFFKQFLHSGKIHKLEAWLKGNYLPKLKIPENEEECRDLLFELSRHTILAKPLTYLILEKAQILKKFRQILTIESEELDLWQRQKEKLRPSILYAVFALLSENGFHKLALNFLPKRQNLKTQLLLARNYYFTQQYQEALHLVEKLLVKYPDNFYVLNDAAIYYFRLGEQSKAEEFFQKLKQYFPNHPAVLHNEALYFEQKALQQIQERWALLEQVESR